MAGAGLLDAGLATGSFNLVTAQYPALRRTGPHDVAAGRALMAAVVPDDTLLVVQHADFDTERDSSPVE